MAFIRPDRAEAMGFTVEQRLVDAFEAAKVKGHGASLLVKDKTAIALATFIHDDLETARPIDCGDERTQHQRQILSGDHQQAVS